MATLVYYEHYTPEQLDKVIEFMAKRYRYHLDQYKWVVAHPNRYTLDEATFLLQLSNTLFAQMQALTPICISEEIEAMVAECNQSKIVKLKNRIIKWIMSLLKKSI